MRCCVSRRLGVCFLHAPHSRAEAIQFGAPPLRRIRGLRQMITGERGYEKKHLTYWGDRSKLKP